MRRPIVDRARKLRKAMTAPEIALWQILRQRPGGLKFRRQHPIGAYVADFCCLSARLIVEIDGIAHDMAQQSAYDIRRQHFLEGNGFRVMRVPAGRALADTASVAAAIVALVEGPLHRPADGPPPRPGEDK